MQGRLSPLYDGRIQAFPLMHWRNEFQTANELGFRIMEWTLDQDRLAENPLMTESGRAEIADLSARYGITIPSVTGDCFMQVPFWKADGEQRSQLQDSFIAVAEAASAAGVTMIVVPLVDNGRLDTDSRADLLVKFLAAKQTFLADLNIQVLFESDFDPQKLTAFIERLDASVFGINYDVGNSAALGFDVSTEFSLYGTRVRNIHVKDRLRGGTTVPLGTGHADFETAFSEAARWQFTGNYILQTARTADENHAAILKEYGEFTSRLMDRHAA